MDVRRLFYKEEQNFLNRGGWNVFICVNSLKKYTILLKKILKHTIYGRPEGGESTLGGQGGLCPVESNFS
jgi:hypothetical protein